MREGLEEARGGAAGTGGDPGDGVELSLVGPDPADPSVLLLRSPDGGTFRVAVDGRLRAAVRSAGPASKPLPAVSEPLRPRDIQARIRAGETAADVAADAGVPIEQVRRYEGPVLAERAHVASLARLAVVRGGPGRLTLEDAVRTRLLARGADPASASWDAWRRDGGWAVQVGFRAAGRDRSAQWSFAPSSRVLEPLDDEARWLTAPSDDPTGRRLAAVRVYDVETDDGGADGLPALALPTDLREEVPGTPDGREAPLDDLLRGLGEDPRDDVASSDAHSAHPEPAPPATPLPSLPSLDDDASGELLGRSALHGDDGPALETEPEDVADDLASRTLELLDALRDRRGRRVPLDLDPDGNPWDDDDEDDDLLNALLDLPPGSQPGSEELQEEVDRARARLRMVTPPRGLSLGSPAGSSGAGGAGDDADDDDGPDAHDGAPLPGRASLGLVPAPPPTEPLATTPAPAPADRTPTAPGVRPLSAAPGPGRPAEARTDSRAESRTDVRDDRADDRADDRSPSEEAAGPRGVPAPGSRRERRAAEEADLTAPAADAVDADPVELEHDGDDPSEQPAKRRRSVPSWDEIVFGAPRRD